MTFHVNAIMITINGLHNATYASTFAKLLGYLSVLIILRHCVPRISLQSHYNTPGNKLLKIATPTEGRFAMTEDGRSCHPE